MANLCNVNGELVPEERAVVPVLDRGFLFGDSVYETMRTLDGVPFAWVEHLERLRASAAGLQLEIELDDAELMRRIVETVKASANDPAYIRIIVTRGTGTAPNIDLAYAPGPGNYVIMARELKIDARPAAVSIVPRLRNHRRALDPAIKSGNYLNNVMGLREAKQRGASECLFLNNEGKVTEASTSNIYLVRDGALFTPPLTAGLLAGITRRLIIRLCAEQGIGHHEQDLDETDVRNAKEVFLSSSLRDITPVVNIDGAAVGGGQPGPFVTGFMAQFATFARRIVRDEYGPRLAELLSAS